MTAMTDKPNINRGKPYQERVCIGCKSTPRDLSNYCQDCWNILKRELLDFLNSDEK